jgi:hypothetical protein
MVVPMFSPRTIAAAMGKLIQPWNAMVIVMVMAAEEDCTMTVSRAPTTIKRGYTRKLLASKWAMNASTSGLLRRSGTESFMICRPRKVMPKPSRIPAISRYFLCLLKKKGMAMAMAGRATAVIWNLKPRIETSQPVMVVPMLAPMTTPMDWVRLTTPAFTRLTSRTVVADEDWMMAVAPIPVRIPAKRLVVSAPMMPRMRFPARFWTESLNTCMP